MGSLDNFFDKKGMMDLFLELEKGSKSFSELKIGLSPNTLVRRLREAQKANLVRQILLPRENKRATIKYALTKEGFTVLKTYRPLKREYLSLRAEVDKLQREVWEKKQEMKLLLSSRKKESRSKSYSEENKKRR